MKVVDTALIGPHSLSGLEREWVYNGLDCCVTAEVLGVLLPRLNAFTAATYDFSRALQGPVLDMRIRGVKVDLEKRERVIEQYYQTIDDLETQLERIVREGTDFVGFNWRSTACLRRLFYEIYRIPPMMTKTGNLTVNRAALEKMQDYVIAKPIIAYMFLLRDLTKRLQVLMVDVDDDGRIRTSYNIAGTSTGRFSSSLSEFGTGGNLQNIDERLRSIFIADDGMKLANFDAEQGESRCVGAIEWNLFKDGTYLDACESVDVHTAVARMCGLGPEYRQMCKILGHGTNYGGKPITMSAHTHIPIPTISDFQARYFKAFPAHRRWHSWVEAQLRSGSRLTTLTGRLRHFFGRRDDDKVLREAIAFNPQGSLSDIVNRGMLNVWRSQICQLLMQNHDSIIIQYPQEREDEIVSKVRELLLYPIKLNHHRELIIPYGCKTGWNWGDYSESNLNGLKKYEPGDKRTRITQV